MNDFNRWGKELVDAAAEGGQSIGITDIKRTGWFLGRGDGTGNIINYNRTATREVYVYQKVNTTQRPPISRPLYEGSGIPYDNRRENEGKAIILATLPHIGECVYAMSGSDTYHADLGKSPLDKILALTNNWWMVKGASAAFQSVGIAAVTTSGTLSQANQAESTFVNCATAALAGSIAGINTATYDLVRRYHSPIWVGTIKTGGTVTNCRFWIGLFSAAPTNVDTIAANALAFRYSTVAGDAGWMAVTNNGVSQSVSSSAVLAFAASTVYTFRIRVDSTLSSVFFSINNSAEVAMSSNVPALATDLGMAMYVITTDGVSKSIMLSKAYCEYT